MAEFSRFCVSSGNIRFSELKSKKELRCRSNTTFHKRFFRWVVVTAVPNCVRLEARGASAVCSKRLPGRFEPEATHRRGPVGSKSLLPEPQAGRLRDTSPTHSAR